MNCPIGAAHISKVVIMRTTVNGSVCIKNLYITHTEFHISFICGSSLRGMSSNNNIISNRSIDTDVFTPFQRSPFLHPV